MTQKAPYSTECADPIMSDAQELETKLAEYRESKEAHQFSKLADRAEQIQRLLNKRASVLDKQEPRIAFVAQKGTGKSTLINGLAGLWIEDEPPVNEARSKDLNANAILPLGNGGTTPCEIVIESGPWQIRVEAATAEETRRTIEQFAEWGWHKAHEGQNEADASEPVDGDDDENEDLPISGRLPRLEHDVERVVRGITGLKQFEEKISGQTTGNSTTKKRKPEAKTRKRHEVVELARNFAGDKAEYCRLVVERAHLDRRVRAQWLPEGNERRWMKTALQSIFEGKYQDQPLPRRIFVSAPFAGVEYQGRAVPLIDTLGLPAVGGGGGQQQNSQSGGNPLGERADLRELLKDPWTLLVLGASFKEPPAPSDQILREMMAERNFFSETLDDRTVIAIIDAGQAGSSGIFEESVSSERESKVHRCVENMLRLDCPGGSDPKSRWQHNEIDDRVFCVNILDNIDDFRDFLRSHADSMRESHKNHLAEAVRLGREFFDGLANAEGLERVRCVIEEFERHLQGIWDDVRGALAILRSNVMKPFAEACSNAHHSSICSMVLGKGSGTISAWSMLEAGFAKALQLRLAPLADGVKRKEAELHRHPNFQSEDSRRVIEMEASSRLRTYDESITRLTALVVSVAKKILENDAEVWKRCRGEWGAGIRDPGYKSRVAAHFIDWGERNSRRLLDEVASSLQPERSDDSFARAMVTPALL